MATAVIFGSAMESTELARRARVTTATTVFSAGGLSCIFPLDRGIWSCRVPSAGCAAKAFSAERGHVLYAWSMCLYTWTRAGGCRRAGSWNEASMISVHPEYCAAVI